MHSLADRIRQADSLLSPYAVPIEGMLGRSIPEQEDDTRFPFQRDRDRILHTSAFRRLQGKTQVFMAGEGDHLRTRLTHTLEVAQIARDIARALSMNEDLAECIALAHDLGHPPFGHAGEEALDAWMQTHGMHFEHNEQSLRIITELEHHSSLHTGLNLNREVEEGLQKHTDGIDRSLESHIADLADAIAYTSHDCDDGITAGIFTVQDLRAIPLVQEAYKQTKGRGTYIRGGIARILVQDLLKCSSEHIENGEPIICFSDDMNDQIKAMRSFFEQHLYPHPLVRTKAQEGQEIVTLLCNFYMEHPVDKLLVMKQRTNAGDVEAVKDYVAGMTDIFAWQQAAEHGLLPE